MFHLRKVYLAVAIRDTKTVVLVAEHNDERVAVLATDEFAHDGMIALTGEQSTAVSIRRFDAYANRLRDCLDQLEKRLGFKNGSFLLVLPTGNFEVAMDERDRVYAPASGVVAPADIEKALHAALDRKDVTPCLTIPYNYSLDEVPYADAPLQRDGSSLLVQRAHYVMKVDESDQFFSLAGALDRSLLKIVPAGLARLHECCDRETLRGGVVGVQINESQIGLNQVRSSFEKTLFGPLSTGRRQVVASVARSLGVTAATAEAYVDGIDLYSKSAISVVRSFSEHYSVVANVTLQQVASALRQALTDLLVKLRTALAHRQFGNAFPASVCFTGAFCDLPGFRRLANEVMGEQCRVILPAAKVIGARSHEHRETLGAVRIMARLNAVVATKEYSMEPYDSAELAKANLRKQRIIFAGRMAAKALEGVLGNK